MKPIFTISTAFIIPLFLSFSLIFSLPINKDINCAMLDWEEIEKMPYPSVVDLLTGDEVLSSDQWEKLKKFGKELPSGKIKEGFYRALRIISYTLKNYSEYHAGMTDNDTGKSPLNSLEYDNNNDTEYEYFENTAYEQYYTNDYNNGKYSSLDLSSQPSKINEEKIVHPEKNIQCTNDSYPNIEEGCLTDQNKNEFTEYVSASTQILTVSTSENPIETELNNNIEVLERSELINNHGFELNSISQAFSSEKEFGSISEKHESVENNNQTNDKTNLNIIVSSSDISDIDKSNENPINIKNYETVGTSTLSIESFTNFSNQSIQPMEMVTTNSGYNDTSEKQTTSSSQESFNRNDFTNNDPDENKNIKNLIDESTETSNSLNNTSYSPSANQLKNTVDIEEKYKENSHEFDNESFFRSNHTSDENHTSVDSATTGNPLSKTEFGEIIEGHSSVRNEKVLSSDEDEHKNEYNSHFHTSHPLSDPLSESSTTAIDTGTETTFLSSEIISTSHSSEYHESLEYVTTSGYETSETKFGDTIEEQGSVGYEKGIINEINNDHNVTSSGAINETLSAATDGDLEITTLASEDNLTMDSTLSSETVFQNINMPVEMIKPNTLATVTSTVPSIIKSNERDQTIKSIDENDRNIYDNEIRSLEETSEGISELTDDHNYNLNSVSTTELNTYATDSEIEILNEVEMNNGKTVIPDSHKRSSEEIILNVNKSDSEEVVSQDHTTQTTELTSEHAEKPPLNGVSDNLKTLSDEVREKEPKFSTVSYEDNSKTLPTNTEQNIILTNEINEPEHKMISDKDKTYATIQTINLTTEMELGADYNFTLDQIETDAVTESSTTPQHGIDNEKERNSEIGSNYGDHTIPDSYEIHATEPNGQDGDIHETIVLTEIVSESAPVNEEITNLYSFEAPPTVETNTEDINHFSSAVNNIHVTEVSADEKVLSGSEKDLNNEYNEDSSNVIEPTSTTIEAITKIDKMKTMDSQNIEIATGTTAEQLFVTYPKSNYDAGIESNDLLGNNNNVKPDSIEVPPTDDTFTTNYDDIQTATESTTEFLFNEVDLDIKDELEENKEKDKIPNSHEIVSSIGSNAEENKKNNGDSNGTTPTMKTDYPLATDDSVAPETGNVLDEQDHGKLESHKIQLTAEPYTETDIPLATEFSNDTHLPESYSNINKIVTHTYNDSEISTTEHSHHTDFHITEPVTTYNEYLNDSKTSGDPNEHKILVTHNNKDEINNIMKGSNNYSEDYSQSTPISYEKEGYTMPYTIASTDPNYEIEKNNSDTSMEVNKFEYLPHQFFDDIESINQIENYHEQHNQSLSTHGSDESIEVDDIFIEKSSVPTNKNTESPDDKQEVFDHTVSDFTGNNLVYGNNKNIYNEDGEHQKPTESEDSQKHKTSSSTPAISLTSEKTTSKIDLMKPPEVVLTVGKSSEHMPESDENIQRISSTTNNEFVVTEPNESNSHDGFYPYLSPVSKHYSQNRPLPNPVPQDLKRSNCVKVPEIIYSRR